MGGKLFLQNRLLPLESVSLARFITDKTSPQRHYHDPFSDSPPPDHTIILQDNIVEVGLNDQNTSHGVQLTELLKVYRSKGETQSTAISAISSAFYELKQWDILFKRACGMDETRRWIEDCIESGKSIYFIVGFRTFLNPSTAELTTSHSNIITEVKLPVSAVAAANVPGVQFGNVLDPGVSRALGTEKGLMRRAESEGEMVFAMQYCRVGFKWFSSKKVDKASLGEGRWKINWGVRSLEEEDEDDVVEASLEEDFDEDDTA
jgi:hypothetical protein